MTELTWLAHFVTKFKMSKEAKDEVLKRMEAIETLVPQVSQTPIHVPQPRVYNGVAQAPSTIAAMERHAKGENSQSQGPIVLPAAESVPPTPQAPVAVTAAAQAALASREQAIRQALTGKPEPGRTAPRKF